MSNSELNGSREQKILFRGVCRWDPKIQLWRYTDWDSGLPCSGVRILLCFPLETIRYPTLLYQLVFRIEVEPTVHAMWALHFWKGNTKLSFTSGSCLDFGCGCGGSFILFVLLLFQLLLVNTLKLLPVEILAPRLSFLSVTSTLLFLTFLSTDMMKCLQVRANLTTSVITAITTASKTAISTFLRTEIGVGLIAVVSIRTGAVGKTSKLPFDVFLMLL